MTELSEKKRSFLRELLLRASKKEDDKIIAKMHRDFMLECVPNGKFYKYRSFDKKGYAISNLKSKTLFCSNAGGFNDPYDLKIGSTYSSIFNSKTEADKAFFTSVFEKYTNVLLGTISLSDCTFKEQAIINKLLDVGVLKTFIMKPQREFKCDNPIIEWSVDNIIYAINKKARLHPQNDTNLFVFISQEENELLVELLESNKNNIYYSCLL